MRLLVEGLAGEDRAALEAVLRGAAEAAGLGLERAARIGASGEGASGLTAPGDDALLILAYSSPALAAARALEAGADPSGAVQLWRAEAEAVARLLDQAPARVAPVDAGLAAAHPDRVFSKLNLRVGKALEPSRAAAPPVEPARLIEGAAESWALQDETTAGLLEALDDAALTAGLRRTGLGPDDFEAAMRARRSRPASSAAAASADTAGLEALQAQNAALGEALELCRADLDALAQAGSGPAASSSSRALVPINGPGARPAPVKRLLARLRRSRDLELIRGSGLFDAAWYADRYPDAADQGGDPALHYLLHGGEEGRPAGPRFSSSAYFDLNPDLKGAGMNPLVHYLRHGREEGRPACAVDGKPLEPGEEAQG